MTHSTPRFRTVLVVENDAGEHDHQTRETVPRGGSERRVEPQWRGCKQSPKQNGCGNSMCYTASLMPNAKQRQRTCWRCRT